MFSLLFCELKQKAAIVGAVSVRVSYALLPNGSLCVYTRFTSSAFSLAGLENMFYEYLF
ncbi:MAG: hypothetical protein JW908_00615 [Anaerolineales bacterium]|nr:hypothetical protein [Anaerolineales bacterium]